MSKKASPFDLVFRTLVQECKKLLIPVVNEIFGTRYTGAERVQTEENEIFITMQDDVKEKITDTSFSVIKGAEIRYYHLECQSTSDGSMILRMFEYDSQIALKHREHSGNVLRVKFPDAALLYLRHTKSTPDALSIILETPGGSVSYEMPILKVKNYSLDEIFEKGLLFLLPFHIFVYETQFQEIEQDMELLSELKEHFSDIVFRLDVLCGEGKIDEYTKIAICRMCEEVVHNRKRQIIRLPLKRNATVSVAWFPAFIWNR